MFSDHRFCFFADRGIDHYVSTKRPCVIAPAHFWRVQTKRLGCSSGRAAKTRLEPSGIYRFSHRRGQSVGGLLKGAAPLLSSPCGKCTPLFLLLRHGSRSSASGPRMPVLSDELNVTVKRAPRSLPPEMTCNSPSISLTSESTIFIPSPLLAVGSKSAGNSGPSSDTDSECLAEEIVSTRTVMLPLAYFAELVVNSLTTRPSWPQSPAGNAILPH